MALLLASKVLATVEFPSPRGAVNDFAGAIPEEYEARMESLARDFWQRAKVALVVAVFPELGGEPIEEFTNRLYETWGIGGRGEDRGLLIVLALRERRLRVETGYGLEGILPDGKVGAIMDRYMIPYLKRGDYGKGLYMGMLAFAHAVAEAEGIRWKEGPVGVRAIPVRRKAFPIAPLLLLLFLFSMGAFVGRRRRRPPAVLFFPWVTAGPIGGTYEGFGGFGGGFGGFGGGLSGGGGATRGF